jgi:hypothetical protein
MIAVSSTHHLHYAEPKSHIAIHHPELLIQRELCQQFVGLGLNLLGGEFHFRLKAGKSYWVIGLSHG